MPSPSPKHIVILGAGIIGLQTALALQDKDYTVTIVARDFPGDEDPKLYTSAWPDPSPPSASPEAHWWAPYVSSFNLLEPSSIPSNAGITSGAYFTTVTVNVPRHLTYLLQKFVAAGGNFIRASLPPKGALKETLQVTDDLVQSKGIDHQIQGFVNATGFGAKELVPDDRVYPTRGQTLVVKGEATAARTFEGLSSIRYVIPRPYSGTSILGGTKQAHNSSTEVDDQTTKEIMEG
ncbi:MAG: hypothetical protein Q9191_006245, partial [Dirinaria sp. TL-2023a]